MAYKIIPPKDAPVAGPGSITFCGGSSAFARSQSVDPSSVFEVEEGTVVELTDAEGRLWYARADGGLVYAFRSRTEQELQLLNDRMGIQRGVHFELVRLEACRQINDELFELANSMLPERCISRQRRRWLKRRMLALTVYQWDLLRVKQLNVPKLREDFRALGLVLPQRDYAGLTSV